MADLDLKIIRHLLASPGELWSAKQLAALMDRPERSIRRSAKRISEAGIAVRLHGSVALSPYVTGDLRTAKSAFRKLKQQLESKE